MFESMQPPPPDAILGIMTLFRADQDSRKIDLSVGVYQDARGKTPTLACVREAERRLEGRHMLLNVWRPIVMVESAPFAVCDAATGELLGSCGLHHIDLVNRLADWGAVSIKQFLVPRREQRQWLAEAARRRGLSVTCSPGTRTRSSSDSRRRTTPSPWSALFAR